VYKFQQASSRQTAKLFTSMLFFPRIFNGTYISSYSTSHRTKRVPKQEASCFEAAKAKEEAGCALIIILVEDEYMIVK
jgi:hypothetical protein